MAPGVVVPRSRICYPAIATTRTIERATDGALVARWARLIGKPLQQWQRFVADLTGEIDPETGRQAYQRVILIVPRRAGKSLLVLCRALATITAPRRRVFYTSAQAITASRMWRDDWFETLGPLERAGHLKIGRGAGMESVRMLPGNGGSTFRLVAPTGAAIRSAATNLAVIDEAREISPSVGEDLESALFPTQATGEGGQTWIVSNAGDASSLWLARWRDIGRKAVAEDRRTGICYIEYAAPDGADLDDEESWYLAHPGLASGNVHIDYLRADREAMSPDAFGAEYLGLWPESLADSLLMESWAAGEDPHAQLLDPCVFAVEVDEDRTTAAIVAAGRAATGARDVVVELVDERPHGPWIAPRLIELCQTWNPIAVTWDAGGPAAALAPDLLDVPARLVPLRTQAVAAGTGAFYDALCHARTITHRPDQSFDAAVAAGRRRRAAGTWLFDRRQPGSGPLIGAVAATWVLRDESGHVPNVA